MLNKNVGSRNNVEKKFPMITPMYGVEIVERKMSVKNIIYTYEKDV